MVISDFFTDGSDMISKNEDEHYDHAWRSSILVGAENVAALQLF